MTLRALALFAALALCAPEAATAAGEREASLRALESIQERGAAFGLTAQVNDGAGQDIRLGEKYRYRFRSDRDGSLTVVHVDPHGVLTLLPPAALRVGGETILPDPNSNLVYTAEPPVGLEVVFAIATGNALDLGSLGVAPSSGGLAVFDVANAADFASRLARAVAQLPDANVSIARLEQRILGRENTQYTTRDVERYFETTRSLQRPKLDLQIHFETDSHTLDDDAKANLDAFGRALGGSLRTRTFFLTGHTDDRGPDAYNLELSERRAQSARRYLVEAHGLPMSQIEIQAQGESEPKEPNDTSEGRRMNRRVEFVLIR